MKKIIESQMTMRDVIDCVDTIKQNEIKEHDWYSYSSQSSIRMIELSVFYNKGAGTNRTVDKKTFFSMVLLASMVGNNYVSEEATSIGIEANKYLGALINDDITIIHLPQGSKYIIYSWNSDRQIIKFESAIKDRIIAIGSKTPFSILSRSAINPPISFFFNSKPSINFRVVKPDMDSNNPKSPFYLAS